jgi:hypothetical protein
MRAALIRSSWLRRVLEVRTDDGWFLVEYNGRGLGYESVWVNGELALSSTSLMWFVPRFDFSLGPRPAVVEVRVWPWLTIRSFRLTVDDVVLYAEGRRMPALPEGWQDRFRGPVVRPAPEDGERLLASRDRFRRRRG